MQIHSTGSSLKAEDQLAITVLYSAPKSQLGRLNLAHDINRHYWLMHFNRKRTTRKCIFTPVWPLCCPSTLTLTRWPWYTNWTRYSHIN